MLDKLNYRLFWNWDHSTNWCLNTVGRQNTGVSNLYTKRGPEFERDYKRMIDWAADHGVSSVGCVALLRDCHGGFESARRICGYAREKGVRVNLIAGLYSYGGLYYEGKSQLSLNNFLEKHPECMAQDLDGTPRYIQFRHPHGWMREPVACPSNPAVRNYVLDTLAYLFMALPELGGIQMETGDCTPVCMCDKCRERRAQWKGGEGRIPQLSLSDMAGIYPDAANTVWSVSPDAWVVCEMYTHYTNNPVYQDAENPCVKAMCMLPDKCFLQWGDRHFPKKVWEDFQPVPEHLRKFRNIYRCHHSTQWAEGRHTLMVEKIRRQCEMAADAGIEGVSIFGECSAFHANTEFNYLAFQYFADHPHATLRAFAEEVMAPRLACTADVAERYIQLAALINDQAKIPAASAEITKILAGITDYDAQRRWMYLGSFLNAYYWESIQKN